MFYGREILHVCEYKQELELEWVRKVKKRWLTFHFTVYNSC
jgi:hypothetical protein